MSMWDRGTAALATLRAAPQTGHLGRGPVSSIEHQSRGSRSVGFRARPAGARRRQGAPARRRARFSQARIPWRSKNRHTVPVRPTGALSAAPQLGESPMWARPARTRPRPRSVPTDHRFDCPVRRHATQRMAAGLNPAAAPRLTTPHRLPQSPDAQILGKIVRPILASMPASILNHFEDQMDIP